MVTYKLRIENTSGRKQNKNHWGLQNWASRKGKKEKFNKIQYKIANDKTRHKIR